MILIFNFFLFLSFFHFLIGIVLSSPDNRRFSQYLKAESSVYQNTYLVPIWEEKELERFAEVLEEEQRADWRSIYNYVGGVPRFLFNFYKINNFLSEFQRYFDSLFTIRHVPMVKRFERALSFNMTDDDENYTLIHIYPAITYCTVTDSSHIKLVPDSTDYKDIRSSCASPYIENKFLEFEKQFRYN